MARITRAYEDGVLTFNFGEGIEPVKVDVNALCKNEEVAEFLRVHGTSQKVGDAASGVEGMEAKRQACAEMAARLAEGDLSRRTGEGGGGHKTMLHEALEALGYEAERIEQALADDATKKALRKHPAVVAELGKIKIKREQAKAKAAGAAAKTAGDLGDLLG